MEKATCQAKVDGLQARLIDFKDPHAQLQWLHRKALRLKAKAESNLKSTQGSIAILRDLEDEIGERAS